MYVIMFIKNWRKIPICGQEFRLIRPYVFEVKGKLIPLELTSSDIENI